MPEATHVEPLRYAVAAVAVAAALIIKLLLNHLIGEESPFLLFFAAVVVSAWHGGLGPGLLATLLAALVINYLFLTPVCSFFGHTLSQNLRLGIFVFEGILISSLSAELKAARRRAEASVRRIRIYQEAFRQGEERYRLMVEHVKDYAIFTIDRAGRVTSWNDGAERIKGYTAEEIMGHHFSCFYTGKEIQSGKPELELELAAARGRFGDEGWRVRKDGTRFWADVVITPLRDEGGQLRGFSKVTRDVTERRATEEVMRKYADIFHVAEIGLFISDPAGATLTTMNPAFAKMHGYTVEELIGRPMLDIFAPECRAELPEQLRLAHEKGHHTFESAHLRKDGTIFPVETYTTVVKDREGKALYRAVSVVDITERKRTKDQIQRLNAEIEQRVLERTAHLEAANKELEAFNYSVTHDLRAPLRSIDGFSKALLEDYTDRLDQPGRNHLQRVRGAVQRMGHLIDDLLNLSRVARGKMNCDTIDLSRLAQSVVEQLQKGQPGRRVELRVADNLVTRGDVRLMQIALENLLSNAWKFTAKQPHAQIELGMTASKGENPAAYFVRDNGAGFDMKYADKLFSPFQRLHGVKEFEGTGVGLATVQRIVRRHGGHIWAEGVVGKGATFYFTLQPHC